MTTQGAISRHPRPPGESLDRVGRVLAVLGALSLAAAVLSLVLGVGLSREVSRSVWDGADEPPSARPAAVQLVPGETVMLWAVDWQGGAGCSIIDPVGTQLELRTRPAVSTARDGRTASLFGAVRAVVAGDHRVSCAGRAVMVTPDLGPMPPLSIWRPLAAGFATAGLFALAVSMTLVFMGARRMSRWSASRHIE